MGNGRLCSVKKKRNPDEMGSNDESREGSGQQWFVAAMTTEWVML